MLQLSGIFTELAVSALNGQFALYKRAMDGQRATTSALFQEQYAALEKKETELRELAQEVEAERRRIQGRGSLRDLTVVEAWLGFKPGGAVFCRICSRFLSQSMFSHHSAVTNQWIDYNPTCGQINHFALTPSMMRQKVGEHLDSPMHAACVLAKATAAESAQAQLKPTNRQPRRRSSNTIRWSVSFERRCIVQNTNARSSNLKTSSFFRT